VKALFVEDNRNFEPAVFDKELLNRIRKLGHLPRVLSAPRITGPPDLSESQAILETGLCLLRVKVALSIKQGARLLVPNAEHLRDLFLQRHARKKIPHAALGGKSRT
jgi:hypothetical protein